MKKKLIFQEYEKVNIVDVDEFFTFSVLYHDKNDSHNLIKQSEFTIISMMSGLSRIFLTKINDKDSLIFDGGITTQKQIENFLSLQCNSSMKVTTKMIYHAIYDSRNRIFAKMSIENIYYNYKYLLK